jgi:hypothetical protein
MSIQNKFVNTLSLVSAAVVAFAAIGCSKGDNRPPNWQESNILKGKCASPRAFNLDKVNQSRQLKLNQSKILVLRTYLAKDVATNKMAVLDMAALRSLPSQKFADEITAADAVIVSNVNCNTLNAETMAPGLMAPVVGKIADINTNKIVIIGQKEVEGKNSTQKIVTIEKLMPNRKSEKAQYAVAQKNDEMGINTLKITIVEKTSGDIENERTTEIIQKTSLNQDETVLVHTSALNGALAAALPQPASAANSDSGAATQAGASGKPAPAVSKSGEVSVSFNQILKLREEAEKASVNEVAAPEAVPAVEATPAKVEEAAPEAQANVAIIPDSAAASRAEAEATATAEADAAVAPAGH